MRIAFAAALAILAVSLFAGVAASPLSRTDFFDLAESGDTLQLRDFPLLKGAESVWLAAAGDSLLLAPGADYTVELATGRLVLHTRPPMYTHAVARYMVYPDGLTSRFSIYTQQSDSLDAPMVVAPRHMRWGQSTKLNITGSKSVSVSVGSDEDVSIDQSLFVQMDGELGDNVYVEAQLSDSYSPVTPEGDSRELSSLDQVFVRVYGEPYEIAFGDLDFDYEATSFMDWNPQYEGLRAGWFGGVDARAAVAVSRAQATTVQIDGEEAKQGPYYLMIDSDNVQVVAGSETIYLDGAPMQRGDDYTIDYSAGSITFTDRWFISSNSRIMAVFQFADEEYRKNMYMHETLVPIGDKLRIGARLAVQNDDRDNPLQTALTDDDKAILRLAGDEEAWGDGAVEVGEGEGAYILTGEPPHYEYVGYDSTGVWQVSFAYVGYGEGDYEPVSSTIYTWVGEGQGSYLPKRRIPAPQSRANYDLSAEWSDETWRLGVEALYSHHDRNTFSDLDDSDNDALAVEASGAWTPDWDRLRPRLDLRYRDIGADLFTFAELDDPYDNYETASFVSMDSLRRREARAALSLEMLDTVTPSVSFEQRDAEGTALYRRLGAGLVASQTVWTPLLTASVSDARQEWSGDDPVTYANRTYSVESSYARWHARLGGKWRRSEDRTERPELDDTGARLIIREAWLETHETKRMAGKLSWEDERNDMLVDDWEQQRKAWTAGGEGLLERDRHLLNARYAHREITSLSSAGDETYDQAALSVQSRPWGEGLVVNGSYELKNISYYPSVRELVWVGSEGVYDSTGVYSEDGEYDWDYVNTGDSELTMEVNASLTLSMYPRLLLPQGSNLFLTRLQSETNIVVFENSRSDRRWDVYLLNPDALMDGDGTIYGRQTIRQTFWYDLVRKRVIAKLSGRYERTLDQRYQEAERLNNRWGEVSLTWRNIGIHDLELAYEQRREEESRYDSDITAHSGRAELVTRPSGSWTWQTELEYMREQGDHSTAAESYDLDSAGGRETLTWFAGQRMRVFGKLDYRHVRRSGSSFLTSLPGKRAGDHFDWSGSLTWKLNTWTNLTFTYSGDSYPEEDVVHRMQMEVKAEF